MPDKAYFFRLAICLIAVMGGFLFLEHYAAQGYFEFVDLLGHETIGAVLLLIAAALIAKTSKIKFMTYEETKAKFKKSIEILKSIFKK
jgi:hypothetical protein